MVYGIVRIGSQIKPAGSTVWLNLADAIKHLHHLRSFRPQHWGNFEVVQIDVEFGDFVLHSMYPYNPKMRSLAKDTPIKYGG